MIEIGRALLQMRRDTSALRGITATGGDVTWKLDTEFEATEAPLPRSVMSLRVGASDTGACIPFTVDETLDVADNGQDNALDLATRIKAAMQGKAWYGPECAIHALTFAGMDSDSAPGARASVTLRWAGRASVRAR